MKTFNIFRSAIAVLKHYNFMNSKASNITSHDVNNVLF